MRMPLWLVHQGNVYFGS